jgi:hypothetical protein
MLEITLFDSNFPHQTFLTPFLKSDKIKWCRDGVRRKINVYTDNFIKREIIDVPQDDNLNICLLLEPYTNPPWTDVYDYIRSDFEKFNLIITHNIYKLEDLLKGRSDKFHYSTKCITSSWLEEKFIGLHKKTKWVSMPFTYKNFSEGHRIRHVIYEKYKNSGLIDFFGDGVPNYRGEFRDCFVDYKYVIVCENCLQRGFNSEKLNDAFLAGCIPLYWGSEILDDNYKKNSIFKFSPDKEFVNFEFEESLEKLQEMLDYVYKEDPYDQLHESVKHNYNYTLKTLQTENNIFEVLKERGLV